jgi:hypothetical protein
MSPEGGGGEGGGGELGCASDTCDRGERVGGRHHN